MFSLEISDNLIHLVVKWLIMISMFQAIDFATVSTCLLEALPPPKTPNQGGNVVLYLYGRS